MRLAKTGPSNRAAIRKRFIKTPDALKTLLRHFCDFPYVGPELDDADGPEKFGFPSFF